MPQNADMQKAQSAQPYPGIYIQGLGLINALGVDEASVTAALANMLPASKSYLQLVTEYIPQHVVYAGVVTAALPEIPDDLEVFQSRNNQLALAALQQIIKHVEVVKSAYGPQRVAVIIGTSTSGMDNTERDYAHFMQQQQHLPGYDYQQHEIGSVSNFIKAYCGLKSFSTSISTACTSSAKALMSGMHLIRSGFCDAAIVGGVDSLCKLTLNGFYALQSLAPEISNPFSLNRSGLNIGEAAALFVLSKDPAAIQLLGGGENSDAYHISAPDPSADGAVACMQQALVHAQVTAADIDYVNLHGTGTRLNDQMEALAINRVFQRPVLCSSSKPLTGHCLGAAGATEAALCCLSLLSAAQGQRTEQTAACLLPVHHWDSVQDPALPVLNLLTQGSRQSERRPRLCMSNSFAFGGNNVSLILGRV